MASKFRCDLVLLYLLFSVCHHASGAKEISKGHSFPSSTHDDHHHAHASFDMMHDMQASNLGLFTINDLHPGNTIPIDFPKNPNPLPQLLTREEANKIPFSSTQLPAILRLFSEPSLSSKAKRIQRLLTHCESKPMNGETKLCATSMESMLDFVRTVFGSETRFRVLTTTYPKNSGILNQNYTVVGLPREVVALQKVGCHMNEYPYAVFYCHSQRGTRAFKVSLRGDNGERVDAVAVCHTDTSGWDPNHVALRLLGVGPGSPVCHFFSANSLLWVPSPNSK